jgi:predicted NAD/FAD-dependent oxidoreductase
VPQTKTLLAAGNIQLSSHNQQRLDRITYESCLSVMAILDVPSALNPPGALMLTEGPIAWISDNQQKGVSAIPSVTIHASGDFSSRYFNEDSNAVGELLIEAAKPFLKAEVEEFQVHGWRYSKPVNIDTKPCMVANEDTDLPPIILAGDAFDGPRVEGAVLSGWAAAEALLCYI